MKSQYLTAGFSEDIYTFWYEVVDDAGNASLNSGEKVVTVDLTPPSASATQICLMMEQEMVS